MKKKSSKTFEKDRLAALADCVEDEEKYRKALESIVKVKTLEEAKDIARAALIKIFNRDI